MCRLYAERSSQQRHPAASAASPLQSWPRVRRPPRRRVVRPPTRQHLAGALRGASASGYSVTGARRARAARRAGPAPRTRRPPAAPRDRHVRAERRARSGSKPAAGRAPRGHARLHRGQRAAGPRPGRRPAPRGRRGGSHAPAPTAPRRHGDAVAAARASPARRAARASSVAPAQEGQRHVQALSAASSRPLRSPGRRVRPAHPPAPPAPRPAGRARRTAAPAASLTPGPASPPPVRPDRPRPRSRRRSRCIATVVERSRTSARRPAAAAPASAARRRARRRRSRRSPTGLSAVPPSGPAMPVIPTPTSAPKRAIAPSASAAATSGETAPWRSISAASTPASAVLAAFGVDDQAAEHVRRGARALGQPAGQQARRCTTRPTAIGAGPVEQQRRDLLVDRGPVVGEQGVAVALAQRRPRSARVGRLGRRLVARGDLDLAAAQAGRDLQALEVHARPPRARAASRRSRTPGSRTAAASPAGSRSRPPTAARKASVSTAVSHIGCSSRGGPGSTTTVGPGAARRRHDQPGRRADGLEDRRALGDHGLLAVGLADRLLVELRPARQQRLRRISAMRSSSASSSTISRPQKPPDHLGGEVVRRRPQAAAGDDQVHALLGQEAQRGQHVLRPVADDRDVGEVDAELAQALREPGAVAVGDAAA